ncbi:MAG: hypothetical protein ACOYOF_19995, partial [Verrucomicrobiaceae bacterium]
MKQHPSAWRSAMRGLAFLGLALAAAASACTIPVFRYALDRWEADPFRLVIPASWATQPDLVKLLVPLRGNAEANVRIQETPDTVEEARLLFPHNDTAIWAGALSAPTLTALLDSPARQALLQRILSGDSATWVVCTQKDAPAEADRIEKRLRYLEQVAALPPQDPNDPDSQLGAGPPLKLRFTVLRVSIDDPAEKLFVAMLAGPKHQDFLTAGTAFAAPVFGKGRVLGAWPVAELDDAAIEDASLFLIGRCSCRVKNGNPGWDIVLKADWERALAQAGEAALEADGAAPSLSSDASTPTTEAHTVVRASPTPLASG